MNERQFVAECNNHGILVFSDEYGYQLKDAKTDVTATLISGRVSSEWCASFRETRDVALGDLALGDLVHIVQGYKWVAGLWALSAIVDGPAPPSTKSRLSYRTRSVNS